MKNTLLISLLSIVAFCSNSFGQNMFPDTHLLVNTAVVSTHALPPVAPCAGTVDAACLANAQAAWAAAIAQADFDYTMALHNADIQLSADLDRYENLVRDPDWSDAHWLMVKRHTLAAASGTHKAALAAALKARTNAYYTADGVYQVASSLCCDDFISINMVVGPPDCAAEARSVLDGMTGRADKTPTTEPIGLPFCEAINVECFYDCQDYVYDMYDEEMEDPIADREEAIEDAHFAAEVKYAIGLAMYNAGDKVGGCAAMNGAAAGASAAADAADASYVASEGVAAGHFVSGMEECCSCNS